MDHIDLDDIVYRDDWGNHYLEDDEFDALVRAVRAATQYVNAQEAWVKTNDPEDAAVARIRQRQLLDALAPFRKPTE